MDLLNIIEEIEKVDPEFHDKISPRRAAIKNITSFGSKVAAAALPFAVGSIFKKAYAQQPASAVIAILNYALTLEYLESTFYNTGINTTNAAKTGLSATELAGLQLITTDETNHVNFLKTVITSLQGTPVSYTAANFDFTAKGTFPAVFTDSNIFLAVAETFEDTGVRAYKGRAPELIGNKVVLTAALDIHSVEARHASHLRMLRRKRMMTAGTSATAAITPWITGANDTGIGSAVDASYAGEDNTTQGGVNVTTLPAVSGTTSTSVATQAFDEYLTADAVLKIVAPFFK